jgi:predicted dithiol-disulfide oxidoreductase (DUF899 family)
MPKCIKCDKYFHPDYCVEVPESDPVVCRCVFCHTDRKEITIEDEETGIVEKKVTKREAEDSYKRYIQDLRYSEKVANVLAGRGTARPKPRN